jgi:hypothetical protein
VSAKRTPPISVGRFHVASICRSMTKISFPYAVPLQH